MTRKDLIFITIITIWIICDLLIIYNYTETALVGGHICNFGFMLIFIIINYFKNNNTNFNNWLHSEIN